MTEKKSQPEPLPFNAMALRASADMIGGIVVGTGLGFLLDRWLNCPHWGLIIGFLLGATAGMLNVYKSLCKAGYGLTIQKFKK
ncbi:MAG: AtpZ/AtpI family protein [Alphaproteobacteria bacterium]